MTTRVPLLFVPGDSFLHRRDPRVKLALFGLLFVYLFSAPNWLWLFAAVLLGIALAANAGTSWRWLGLFWAVHLPSFVVLLGWPLAARAWADGFAGINDASEELSGEIRLIMAWSAAIFVSVSLFSTMEPDQVKRGLRGLRLPVPLALSVALSYRLLYVAIEQGIAIVEAMRLKGVELKIRDPRKLASGIVSISLPVLFSLVRRASPLVYALDMRGAERDVAQEPLDSSDWVFLFIPTVAVVLSILTRLS